MKNIFSLLFICLFVFSCTKNFEEVNTNPNQPESVSAALLLPSIIFDYADIAVNQNFGFGDIVGQYTANYEFNGVDIFDWTSDSRYWDIYPILQDVKDIETFGIENKDVNYEAVAIILQSYGVSILTDVYGDVPYLEATKASDNNFTPEYDTQQSIYNQVISELNRANELIDVNATIRGDILFDGNMSQWKRFANSLRLRMLMRSSTAQDNSVAISSMVMSPSQFPLIETNADNAIYHYSGSLPDLSPYSSGRGRDYDFYLGIPTSHIIDVLKNNNDPRMEEWFAPQAGTTEYIGTAPGQDISNVGRPDDFSSKNASFFNDPGKLSGIFMTASEVHFLLAEAAEAGMISSDAKAHYDNAVSLSFEQWGVEMPVDYLTTTASYDSSTEVLAIQKWISLYQNSLQAWLNWKRTSLPSFIQAGPGTVNGGEFPVRLMYPALEQSVNPNNYESAISKIGGDNINSRVWWDK